MTYHKGYPAGRWRYVGREGFEQGPGIRDRIYEDYDLGEVSSWLADTAYAVIGRLEGLARWRYVIPNPVRAK